MQPNKQVPGGQQPARPKRAMDMLASDQPHQPSQAPAKSIIPVKTQPAEQAVVVKPKAPAEPPQKKPRTDTERPSAKFWLGFLLVIIILSLGAAGTYYFVKYRPAHKQVTSTQTKADNTNHIVDDTVGVKFAISKDLTAVDKTVLVRQNPSFVYGFEQKEVSGVTCVISQQKRTKAGGTVAPEALRDGTLQGIKKSYPGAKLVDFQDIMLTNGQDAANLIVTYNNGKTDIKERMVVAATSTNVTFTFCTSPAPLFDFYSTKFNPFFDSLEVY